MAEHAAVLDVSRYRPAAGRRDDLVAGMRRLAAQAARAEGCFGAQVCISSRDQEALVAVSRWRSAEALETFAATAASIAERERLTDLVAGAADHEHLTPL
jgi:quinol monooxygenase YgiN